jgi:hypothetical protein
MRKIIFYFLIFLVGSAGFAHAAFLWPDSVNISGEDYVVHDRSNGSDSQGSDSSVKYMGYLSTIEDYSGYYIGTFEGNTNNGDMGDSGYSSVESNRVFLLINDYLNYYNTKFDKNYVVDTDYNFKIDDIEDIEGSEGINGPLTVTWHEGYESGEWTYNDPSHEYGLGFYAVKGSTEFALYFVDPSETQGKWTTRHLLTNGGTVPEISHFVGVPTGGSGGDGAPNPPAVPEPTTLLLLGAGLLGLGFVGRRRSGR